MIWMADEDLATGQLPILTTAFSDPLLVDSNCLEYMEFWFPEKKIIFPISTIKY